MIVSGSLDFVRNHLNEAQLKDLDVAVNKVINSDVDIKQVIATSVASPAMLMTKEGVRYTFDLIGHSVSLTVKVGERAGLHDLKGKRGPYRKHERVSRW